MRTHTEALAPWLAVVLSSLAIVAVAGDACSAAPPLIQYQGYLEDSGVPVDGNIELLFELFPIEAGGTAIWSESHTATPVTGGVFHVVLGSLTVFDPAFLDDAELWIETSVDAVVFGPRRRLLSVPYAMRASVADVALNGASDNDWEFHPNGTDIFRSTGTVGIGTESPDPATRLHVEGFDNTVLRLATRVIGPHNNSGSHIEFENIHGDAGSLSMFNLPEIRLSLTPSGALASTIRLTSGVLAFDKIDQVSILGTTDPVTSLSIPGWTLGSTGNAQGRDFFLSGDGGQDDLIYILDSGEIGIGTVDPEAQLHIVDEDVTHQQIVKIEAVDPSFSGAALVVENAGSNRSGSFLLSNTQTFATALSATTAALGPALFAFSTNASPEASPALSVLSSNGKAAEFEGDVNIIGNLTKSSGTFKIDHPLDPANKYLSHSFVESPDMMNVYNGNVTLDENGEAWVELPDWFEALNRDVRYQLTTIGAFAPVYVASKVSAGRFQIAGGSPDLEVSWMVTGIRQDAYANLHRTPVEETKAAVDRGSYLNPEAFGFTNDLAIGRREVD